MALSGFAVAAAGSSCCRLQPAFAAEPAPWPDDFVARLEALALLGRAWRRPPEPRQRDAHARTLVRRHGSPIPRASSPSACATPTKPATADVRAALDVKPDEPLGYRRVKLKCGEHVLSEADNWYVPARLTPEMNHVLETTDTPFGKAVAALRFRRHTLSADLVVVDRCPRAGRRARRLGRRGALPCPSMYLNTAPCCSCRTAGRSANWSRPIPARCWPSRRQTNSTVVRSSTASGPLRPTRGCFGASCAVTLTPLLCLNETRERRMQDETSSPPGERVKIEISDGVAEVTLNRPDKLNALDPAHVRGDHRGGRAAEPNGGLARRCPHRRGRAFCSGLDKETFASIAAGGGAPGSPIS